MKREKIFERVLSVSLLVAAYAFLSASVLAGKTTGEITVFSTNDSENSSVKVNGEVIQSGRSLFSGSVIATDANSRAIVNIKDVGKLELSPNTQISLTFDDKGISVDLSAGEVTALEGTAIVKTSNGVANLNPGESASAAAPVFGVPLVLFGIILAGIATAIIVGIATSDTGPSGGGTTASPIR